ncbi:MAG TPA: hypothetical protein VI172_08365 [Candidatus Dormibacteraeota bacterium]|jgi:hypothetical protein
MTTINPATVEQLIWLGDGATRDGWTKITAQPGHTSYRHHHYTLVLRDAVGDLWGVDYATALTVEQAHELPWRQLPTGAQMPLTRLYPHTVTTVEYRKEAP